MDTRGFVILVFLLMCTLKFSCNKNKYSVKGLKKLPVHIDGGRQSSNNNSTPPEVVLF